jgi:hypothetical protein
MNKKELGASLRRGVVAGTIAGSLSGFAAFAAHAAIVPLPASVPSEPASAPNLPPLPAAPSLAPLPNVRAVQVPSTVVLPPIRVTNAAPLTTTRSS